MNRNDNVVTTTIGGVTWYDFRRATPRGTVVPGKFIKVKPRHNMVQLSQEVSDRVREECLNRVRVRVVSDGNGNQEVFLVFNVKAGLEFSLKKRKNQRSIAIYNQDMTEWFSVMYDIWDDPEVLDLSDSFFDSGFLVYRIAGVRGGDKANNNNETINNNDNNQQEV
ncbi:MAG: hypothetical protein E7068_02440 [Lentimicrobiaceae bacterium]|nr:hypothetical protein [Lentimicrobiaceae bacterium]